MVEGWLSLANGCTMKRETEKCISIYAYQYIGLLMTDLIKQSTKLIN